MHDVLVVGAGPAGSYAAYCLATRGYDVLVLEEDDSVGRPTNCSGLIGAEAFQRYDLPKPSILRSFDSARFISPSGAEALVHADKPEAYAVDRAAFDQSLADQAKAAGATYKLGAGCSGITRANGGVAATIRGQNGDGRVRARVVIVATGVNYSLSRDLGAPRPTRFLRAAQTEVRMKGVKEVEVYLGGRISPGSFGWAIPLGGDRVKLGVCNEGRAFPYMQRLLESPRVRSRLRNQRPEVKTKPIPISPAKRTYADRVLLAGDAAGQVKPTTGGGIHYGIVCGELAARTLDDAFSHGDLSERRLARYQARWRRELGWEIVVGSYFRRFGKWLTDSQIDELVRSYTNPALRDLVQSSAAFERHSRFVLALSRSPIFWRALWAPIRAHLVRR